MFTFNRLPPKSKEEIDLLLDISREELKAMWRATSSMEVAVLLQKKMLPLYENEDAMFRDLVGDELFEKGRLLWKYPK